MISIITAIHNQINVNQLFWASLKKYTNNKFELIIIDNASTDGSAEFFESVGATVIRNKANYSYPRCQNQGIEIAKYDWLVFMNNDIIVSKDWDMHIIENMQTNNLEVATVCGIEHLENITATRKIKHKWKRIKNILSLFGKSKFILSLMHKLMYKRWEDFTQERYNKFLHQTKEGIVGNTVVIRRSALEKIGLWDERIQAADFDLYLRTKKRELEHKDMLASRICLDTFIHHYIRLTIYSNPPKFADQSNLIKIEDKWGDFIQMFPKG